MFAYLSSKITATTSNTESEPLSVTSGLDVVVDNETPEEEPIEYDHDQETYDHDQEATEDMTQRPFAIAEATEPNEVVNFMGGKSFKLTPLDTLKIVSTSMICGENQYYRTNSGKNDPNNTVNIEKYAFFKGMYESDAPEDDYFNRIVSKALDFDFEGTLKFIEQLRSEYMMRLNTHYVMVSAINHPSRAKFNEEHPNVMKQAIRRACFIPTDWTTQFQLLKGTKKPIPTIWKKAIASMLEEMTAYHASKYIHGSKSGNATSTHKPKRDKPRQVKGRKGKLYYPKASLPEVVQKGASDDKSNEKMSLANLVDLVRLTHPTSTPVLDELIRTGKVKVNDSEQTWEKLRSANKTWFEITSQIRMPHMALLRNLRNIIEEFDNDQGTEPRELDERMEELNALLISGVKNGKQFPFRYYSAYKAIRGLGSNKYAIQTIDALNRCLLESLDTIPELNGQVDCLTDNSGSARGTLTTEYGSVGVYEISNLSAILTAYRATKGGNVWVFGDRLEQYYVRKEESILTQLDKVNKLGERIGAGTETGVWLFWENALLNQDKLDHVFIYSDMQAGYGNLYASHSNVYKLNNLGACVRGQYIDVLHLVKLYRERIYAKVNVFSVQVAGYDNSIMPDILYRGAILSGWTGKEAKLAYEMTKVWDEAEANAVHNWTYYCGW
jgi:hypothetical protein